MPLRPVRPGEEVALDPSPSTRPSDAARPRSGHRLTVKCLPATSVLGAVFIDPATGTEYPTRALMRTAIRKRHSLMLTDFERLVNEKCLGQDPWERLPQESELAYSRFREYLTMQPKAVILRQNTRVAQSGSRSIRRLADKLALNPDNLAKHAARFHWKLRADCWDRELDRQEDEAFKEERRVAGRNQARLGQKLQRAADFGADILLTGAVEMSASDVARLADVGVKVERLSMEKSTSNESSITRFVYEGPKPKWAEADIEVVQIQQSSTGSDMDTEADNG